MSSGGRAALLLAGGHSRRMGRSKAALPFGAQTLLQHMVEILGQAVPLVLVVRASGQILPALPAGVKVVCDKHPDRGPLEGLAVGLEQLEGAAEAVFVSAVDTPFLKPAFIGRMFELLGPQEAVAPRVDGRTHPLSACYRTLLADRARSLLQRREDSVRALLLESDTRWVGPEEFHGVDPELCSLNNLNNPAEYRAALARLADRRG